MITEVTEDDEDKDALCGNPLLNLIQILISSSSADCIGLLQSVANGICFAYMISLNYFTAALKSIPDIEPLYYTFYIR